MVRGGSRAAATFKMERFVTIIDGLQPLTIITKRSTLDFAAVLDSPLVVNFLVVLFKNVMLDLQELTKGNRRVQENNKTNHTFNAAVLLTPLIKLP